jgi:hypothetical protein
VGVGTRAKGITVGIDGRVRLFSTGGQHGRRAHRAELGLQPADSRRIFFCGWNTSEEVIKRRLCRSVQPIVARENRRENKNGEGGAPWADKTRRRGAGIAPKRASGASIGEDADCAMARARRRRAEGRLEQRGVEEGMIVIRVGGAPAIDAFLSLLLERDLLWYAALAMANEHAGDFVEVSEEDENRIGPRHHGPFFNENLQSGSQSVVRPRIRQSVTHRRRKASQKTTQSGVGLMRRAGGRRATQLAGPLGRCSDVS